MTRPSRYLPVALLSSLLVAAIGNRLAHSHRAVTVAPTAPDAASVEGGIVWVPPPSGLVPEKTRMQHGDRRRAGRSPARGPTAVHAKWTAEGLGPIEAQVIPSPDESTLYVATLGGELVALSRADGTVKFRIALGGRSYTSPCVNDAGDVYVASDSKKLFAVHPSGQIAWTLDLPDEGDTACALGEDGRVHLAAGRTLLAVTPNGEVAWRFAADRKIFTAPAVDDAGRVFVGSQDHHVYAVESGRKVWSVDLGADVDGSPAIDDDGTVVVGSDGGEVVRLTADGSVAWTAPVGGFVRGALSIARGGDVLAGVYGPRSCLVRLDGKTGSEKASYDVPGTGAPEMGVHGGALEDREGKLYFGAQDDHVYLVGAGAERASSILVTHGDVDAPITLLRDGTLVVASDDGDVYTADP